MRRKTMYVAFDLYGEELMTAMSSTRLKAKMRVRYSGWKENVDYVIYFMKVPRGGTLVGTLEMLHEARRQDVKDGTYILQEA